MSSILIGFVTYFFEELRIWYVYVVNQSGGKQVTATLGSRLRSLRKKKKMKQEDVASALSIARSTYSNYENDVHSPDKATLSKIARLFGASTDYLLMDYEKDDLGFFNDDRKEVAHSDITKWQNLAETLAKALQMHEETSRIREEANRLREENERERIEKVDAVAQDNLRRVINKLENITGSLKTGKDKKSDESKSIANG